MTQTLGFGWTYSTSTSYVITEFLADGTSRTVSAQYATLWGLDSIKQPGVFVNT